MLSEEASVRLFKIIAPILKMSFLREKTDKD